MSLWRLGRGNPDDFWRHYFHTFHKPTFTLKQAPFSNYMGGGVWGKSDGPRWVAHKFATLRRMHDVEKSCYETLEILTSLRRLICSHNYLFVVCKILIIC